MSFGPSNTLSNALAADASSLNQLKMQAGQSSPQAIRETAKQFESLFMRELLKSMREATMKSGMLDNAGTNLGTDLFDQQMAVQMSGQPGGLSELIAAQLSRQMGVVTPDMKNITPMPNAATSALQRSSSLAAYGKQAIKPTVSQSDFVQNHTQTAIQIEKETGIPASYMVGQAGHETGWGQHEIKLRGGKPSYNLFGIKADKNWTGKVAEVTTTEFVNGVSQMKVAKFRAYNSYDESFRDYAKLITQSPRYAKVSQQAGTAFAFASGLQKAGYATDPNYAVKLSRAIETTQRLQQRTQVVAQSI
jgi:flagellar protein FlgJ